MHGREKSHINKYWRAGCITSLCWILGLFFSFRFAFIFALPSLCWFSPFFSKQGCKKLLLCSLTNHCIRMVCLASCMILLFGDTNNIGFFFCKISPKATRSFLHILFLDKEAKTSNKNLSDVLQLICSCHMQKMRQI